jgi:chemotaxis response regulator CheB
MAPIVPGRPCARGAVGRGVPAGATGHALAPSHGRTTIEAPRRDSILVTVDITEALERRDADVDAAIASGLDFFVVGIGASAGGLAAIKDPARGCRPRPDMAFVVVLHLSPTHESNAAAIFQPSTRMPVLQVTERSKIERNHVYVIPPGRELAMVDGALDVAPAERTPAAHGHRRLLPHPRRTSTARARSASSSRAPAATARSASPA